jgi:hypothetical protein
MGAHRPRPGMSDSEGFSRPRVALIDLIGQALTGSYDVIRHPLIQTVTNQLQLFSSPMLNQRDDNDSK